MCRIQQFQKLFRTMKHIFVLLTLCNLVFLTTAKKGESRNQSPSRESAGELGRAAAHLGHDAVTGTYGAIKDAGGFITNSVGGRLNGAMRGTTKLTGHGLKVAGRGLGALSRGIDNAGDYLKYDDDDYYHYNNSNRRGRNQRHRRNGGNNRRNSRQGGYNTQGGRNRGRRNRNQNFGRRGSKRQWNNGRGYHGGGREVGIHARVQFN